MNKKHIALVEIGGSHDECLLTQMHAIHERGHSLLLLTTPEIVERNPEFKNYVNEIWTISTAEKKRKEIVKQLWQKLKDAEVDIAVLNTAQGKMMRDLCLKTLFHKMEFVGIIHTTRMFTESFTQKIIHRKIKKYLLLSEFLRNKVTPQKGLQLDYFYPIRYPGVQKNKLDEKAIVAVIGGVEERRKDLKGFIEMAKQVSDNSVHFVFIGKSDPNKAAVSEFLKNLESEKLLEKVTTFDHFVSQEEFDGFIQRAHLILPLVHPDTPSADQYFKNQISGAMTVAFGYKVPMLIHEAYSHIEEMQPASFYYRQETFAEKLNEALSHSESKAEEMCKHIPYTHEEQEKRYADFLDI